MRRFPSGMQRRAPGLLDRLRRGQGLLELAMVLPFLLLILLGAIDLGRVFFAYAAISNAAYEAARQAARGGYLFTPCVLDSAGTACDSTAMQNQLCPSTDPSYEADAQQSGSVYQVTTIYATLRCELGSLFRDAVTDPTDCPSPQSPNPTMTLPIITSPGALRPPIGDGCIGWGYNLSTDASGAQEVTVTVTYNFTFLTPVMFIVNGTNNYLTLVRTVSVAVLTAPGNPYPTPTPTPTTGP
jgi:Flp pilus assembly protein TadG